MVHKTEEEFAKCQSRAARSTLVRLKYRLAANRELYETEVEFEDGLDQAILAGEAKMLDAVAILRIVDEQA